MPYAKKEDKAAQMRDFRQRKKAERKVERESHDRLIATFLKVGVQRRKERSEMLKIIRVIAFTISRTDLTDSEKVMQICKVPIPDELTPYLKQPSKEVTA